MLAGYLLMGQTPSSAQVQHPVEIAAAVSPRYWVPPAVPSLFSTRHKPVLTYVFRVQNHGALSRWLVSAEPLAPRQHRYKSVYHDRLEYSCETQSAGLSRVAA